MTLTIRKIIVLSLIGMILLLGNVLAVANWLTEKGVVDKANWIREEFLTGTAIAVIVALLILLVNPKGSSDLPHFFSPVFVRGFPYYHLHI
jgi:hypothetical protein